MTPGERERRIEAAARAFYAPVNPTTWVAPTVLTRNIAAALDAADEAVPVVPKAEADRAEAAARDLRRAVAEHRTTIHNAGVVRVDSRDQAEAEAKHRADERLWARLDSPSFSGEEGTEA